MITTPHSLAGSTGIDVLRDGGSVADAAIATKATLCVAYPRMAGPGDDGSWMIAGDEISAINASDPTASAEVRDYHRNSGYESIPDRGPELTISGAVDGWRLVNKKHGMLSWVRLFEDAITCTRDGVPVTADLARWISNEQVVVSASRLASEKFLDDGSVAEVSITVHQPALADSFERIASAGKCDKFQ